jgi:hypothetical protein
MKRYKLFPSDKENVMIPLQSFALTNEIIPLPMIDSAEHPASAVLTPIVQDAAPLIEEEAIIAALGKEKDHTPLKLLYLQYRDVPLNRQMPPRDCLQCISSQMRALWEKTMGQELPFPYKTTLGKLQALQTEVLEANLLEIGKLWDKGFNCFGCLISFEKVKEWVATDSEQLRERLTSAEFCKKIVLRCTFLPPEVIPLIQDPQWLTIGRCSFCPVFAWSPKCGIFLQVMMEKRDRISEETLQDWLNKAAGTVGDHGISSNKTRRLQYEGCVVKPLVDWAISSPNTSVDQPFLTFVENRDGSMDSNFWSLTGKVSDDALNTVVTSSYKKYSTPQCLALLRRGGNRISSEVLGQLLEFVVKWKDSEKEIVPAILLHAARIHDSNITTACFKVVGCNGEVGYYPKCLPHFLPHVARVSDQGLGTLLKSAVSNNWPDWVAQIFVRIAKVSDEDFQAAFVSAQAKPLIFSRFLAHPQRLGSEVLGKALYDCTKFDARDCVSQLLLHFEQIPQPWRIKTLLYTIVKGKEELRSAISSKMRHLSLEDILPHLEECSRHAFNSIISLAQFSQILKQLNEIEEINVFQCIKALRYGIKTGGSIGYYLCKALCEIMKTINLDGALHLIQDLPLRSHAEILRYLVGVAPDRFTDALNRDLAQIAEEDRARSALSDW